MANNANNEMPLVELPEWLQKTQELPDNRNQIFSLYQAHIIVARYVCAQCWGRLTYHPVEDDDRNVQVTCFHCGDDVGLVTIWWMEKQLQIDAQRALSAKQNLINAGVIENPIKDKSTTQIMRELGF